MRILSFLNPTRGSGKTTLSTNLARALHDDQGRKVLLVDSDPEGSTPDWHAAWEDTTIPRVALDRPNHLKTLASLGAAYDFVLVDGVANQEEMVAAAVGISDAVLIPVPPRLDDVWVVVDLVDRIQARQEATHGLPCVAFVVSRAIDHTKLGRDVAGALAEYGFPVFESVIVQREIYSERAAEGLTIFDGPRGPASAEITLIAVELIAFLASGFAPAREGAREGRGRRQNRRRASSRVLSA